MGENNAECQVGLRVNEEGLKYHLLQYVSSPSAIDLNFDFGLVIISYSIIYNCYSLNPIHYLQHSKGT